MKTSPTPQNNKQNYAASTSTNKPEIRDNLDSRNNEEQDDKGDDTTHNEKETKKNKVKKTKK